MSFRRRGGGGGGGGELLQSQQKTLQKTWNWGIFHPKNVHCSSLVGNKSFEITTITNLLGTTVIPSQYKS